MHSLNLHLISLMLFLLINRFIPIESSSRIIVVNNHNNKAALGSSSSSSSGSGNKVIHNDLIAKIISETTANRQNGFGSGGGGEERTSLGNSDKSLKTTTNIMNSLSGVGSNDVYTFMDKLADLGVRTRCDASMLRSDVQNRVRQLKSIVSSCPVYCRVAVNSRSGFVYGAREFNLETLWERVDVDDASLIKNNALLGAYFIKFVSSKRYLCITKYGKLFTSVNKSNDCLWFNDEPKLTSAVHKNVDLLIDKNCHLDAETNRPRQYKRRRSTNNINNNNNNNDRDTCESNVKITSGPSPNLKKFFHTCQSTLLGTNNQPQPQHPPAQVHHTHYPKPSTKTNKMAKERVELFCANYLLDEIEFADEVNRSNPKSQSHRIPDICIEYLVKYQNKSMPVLQTTTPTPTMSVANMSKLELAALLNKAALKPKQKPHQHQQQHYQQQQQQQEHQLPSIEHELNLDENYHNNVLLPSDGDPSSSSSSNNKVDTNMRKCYLLRSTSLYQKCMEKHYKCYRFNNNPENLRKCRKKYGVTPAPRKKIIIH